MKILYLILTTKHQPNREYNQTSTWLNNQDYLYLTDESGYKKLKCSDNDTYTSNEEKQINGINYVRNNLKNLQYDWFCFCDNDTFVYTKNAKNALKTCDPDKVWGYVLNKQKDPDNPIFKTLGDDFEYCSGGAGYFISKQLFSKLPNIQNYNLGYGDVSFGYNFKNLKLKFGDLKGTHPQHFNFYKDTNDAPVSYHYIKTPEDFTWLYRQDGTYNVVSFSLWGKKEKYRFGAIENIKLAKSFYPGWKLRFYIDESIELDFAKRLHDLGCQVYQTKSGLGSFEGMYWRFWVNDDLKVKNYCIRDADSRFNKKELAAVTSWIDSDLPFHIMRDHVNHVFPIQGGLWGGTTGIIKDIKQQILQWNQYDKYSCDQFFLANIIYPQIKNKCKVHCTYMEKKPFPPHDPLPDGQFVGQIFDEFNKGYSE